MRERVEGQLAKKIRKVRTRRGLTLAQLGKQANVSVAMLSKIENAKVSSPVSTYARLAKALEIPLSELFSEDELISLSLVRKVERKQCISFSGYIGEAIAYKRSPKKMEPFIFSYTPRNVHPPPYQHDNEELIFVLEGDLEFRYGKDKYVLTPGDCVYFDANIKHSARALNHKPALALVVES